MNVSIPVNLKYTPFACGDYVSYLEIINALARADSPLQYSVYCNDDFSSHDFVQTERLLLHHLPYPVSWMQNLRYLCWLNTVFLHKTGLQKDKVGLFINQKMPHFWQGKSLFRVQDLAFHYFKDYFTPKDRFRLRLDSYRGITSADHILAISENTKKDIVELYNIPANRITVAYNGISKLYRRLEDDSSVEAVRRKYQINSPYILHTGVLQKRKNLVRLFQAFELFKQRCNEDIKLVLVGGKGWLYDEILEQRSTMKEKDSVIFCGKVSSSELLAFYNGAQLFVLPSLYEGFGIPLAEAMACGTPSIAADSSSLPEVGGDAALYFDPYSIEEIAEAIAKVVFEEATRNQMIVKGFEQVKQFSWDETANKINNILLSFQ